MLALSQITTLHNTLRRIPIQDTTGAISHGYHITYDTLTGEMIWAADAGGSGHPHRVDTSGSGDLVNLDSLTLWQGFGIDLAAVTSANWDSVKFYLDTAWITANYSPPFADSTDKITDDGVGYNDIDWGAGANQVELVDVPATAWRVFYSNGSGVITELVLGANGTYLESNGAAAAPTFTVPSGAGLSFFTEADDNDTSVFTATAPNTTVAFNDQLTMQGNNITGVGDIEMTGNDILELHAMDVDSGFILQDADAGVFRTYVQFVHDTMFFGAIDATNGFERIWQWRTSVLTGLTLPTLGVPTITGNVDWTANIIDMNYLDTAEIRDTIESIIDDSTNVVRSEIRDTIEQTGTNFVRGRFDSLGVDTLTANNLIEVGGASSGTLTLSGITSGSWSLTVADVAGTPTEWVLPTGNGSSGYHLATDGAGALSWAAPGAGAWTDAGTIIYPTTGTGDTVVVGGTTAANSDIILGGDGTVVFNEQGNGVDFRVEGDTAQYLFEVNGSKTDTGEVNINGGLNVTLPADDNITIDGRTFPRTVTLGAMRWNHTPEASTQNTKALYLDIDANSVASTEALHIEYKATLLAAGETGVGIDFEGNTSTSIGGVLAAFNVNKVGIGSATVRALQVGPAVDDVIHHNSGSFGVVGYARDSTGGVHTDFTAAFNSSAIDSTMFDNDNDVIYIGEDATFNEIDVVLNTAAGGAGIDPVFEFSIAGPGWTAFTPIDNTEGFRVDGDIIWETADLTSWAAVTVDGQSAFWIRITRTRNSIPVDPIEDRIRTVTSVSYTWNSTGDLNINSLTTTQLNSPLIIGGTGTTSDLSLQTTSGVGAAGADMHFLVGSDGATEAVTILNDGKVGIGTNAPNAPLEVKGALAGTVGGFASGMLHVTSTADAQFSNSVITGHSAYLTNTQLWYFGSTSSGNNDIAFINRQDGDMHFNTNNTFRMIIDATGYIGIGGTLSPPERLSVVGNIATGDTAAGDIDVFHYFSTNGSWVTEYLKWDDGLSEFQLSDDLSVTGDISATTIGGITEANLVDKSATEAITGAWDFGGAISLEIPNSGNPTTDAEGEIAWDANDDALEVYSGDEGESVLIPIYRHISIPIVLPDSIQLYTPDLIVFHVNALLYPFGIEIDLVSIQLESDAAYSMVLEEWSSADPPVLQNIMTTVTTGATDTYAEEAPDTDGNLDAGDRIVLNIPTTDVDVVTVEIFFHVTEGN